ncbi:RWP-RK domain [Phytophthora infestans]|uniref:RWP-RK domain n=1 Tax=Phytophthora infestans TaxID=4787 RepID=A0A8S9U4Z5_PHYIN|nr:RWP-RK domain [Phytophthora infestans]
MSLRRAPWPLQDASGRAESSSDSDQDEAAFSDATHDYLEQEEAAPSDSEAEDTTHIRKRRQRIHFDVAQLQTVYHLPLKTAAERLGICEAALKRICRRNHITMVRIRFAQGYIGFADVFPARSPEQRDFQDQPDSVTPVQFDDRLRRLEEEQNQIIMSAHQSYRPRRSELTSSALPPPFRGETLMVHLHGFQSSTAGLPPLDLNRLDRDFPLLFLANVCESVRAYNA